METGGGTSFDRHARQGPCSHPEQHTTTRLQLTHPTHPPDLYAGTNAPAPRCWRSRTEGTAWCPAVRRAPRACGGWQGRHALQGAHEGPSHVSGTSGSPLAATASHPRGRTALGFDFSSFKIENTSAAPSGRPPRSHLHEDHHLVGGDQLVDGRLELRRHACAKHERGRAGGRGGARWGLGQRGGQRCAWRARWQGLGGKRCGGPRPAAACMGE